MKQRAYKKVKCNMTLFQKRVDVRGIEWPGSLQMLLLAEWLPSAESESINLCLCPYPRPYTSTEPVGGLPRKTTEVEVGRRKKSYCICLCDVGCTSLSKKVETLSLHVHSKCILLKIEGHDLVKNKIKS